MTSEIRYRDEKRSYQTIVLLLLPKKLICLYFIFYLLISKESNFVSMRLYSPWLDLNDKSHISSFGQHTQCYIISSSFINHFHRMFSPFQKASLLMNQSYCSRILYNCMHQFDGKVLQRTIKFMRVFSSVSWICFLKKIGGVIYGVVYVSRRWSF